jgi:succinoglycan biosynthesis transport protein ExoP
MLDVSSEFQQAQGRRGAIAGAPGGDLALPSHDAHFRIDESEEKFSALTLVFRVLQYRRFILIMIALGSASGVLGTALQPSMYEAITRLEIVTQTAKTVEDLQIVKEMSEERAMNTARERLLSRKLAQRVAFDVGLADNIPFLLGSSGFSIARIVSRIFRLDDSASIRRLDFKTRENIAVGRLLGALTVRPVVGTNIVSIIVRVEDPALAARIADQFALSYLDQRLDQTAATSTSARNFIQEQVAQVKSKLEDAEQALIDYARSQNLQLAGDTLGLVQGDVAAINAALLEVQKKRIGDEHLITFIKQGRAADLPQVLENKGIIELRGKIGELKGQYQQNLDTLKPAMPEMKQLAARIQELERQVNSTVSVVADSIQLGYADSVEREKALQRRLDQLQKDQSDFQGKNVRYTILRREVESYRSQYQGLIGKLNDIGVASEIRTPTATITDNASVPSRPSSPLLLVDIVIGLLASVFLTGVIIYFLELLNNTFARPEQVEAELGIALLGVLPAVTSDQMREQMENSQSSISEAYRSLRTSLQFTGHDGIPRTIAVTSAEPSEGKSTTVYKLAMDLASLGARVLVIDADMRKPSMHRLFGTDHANGLSNLLTNTGHTGDVQEMFRPTKISNVSFLSSGILPPNPADLLSSSRMASVISLCNKAYDVTLIDSPPVIGLADAPIIARLAEATLLIVSAHQVTRKSAQNALKRIRATGGIPIGAALTKFTIDRFDYNYAYRYMYYNSYYRYGATNPVIEGPPGDTQRKARPKPSSVADWTRRTRRALRNIVKRYQ